MIELQRKLIGDSIRNSAFAEALKRVIKPGMEVLDLGSGTGFLSFLASRLGAKHVTCIEVGDIQKTAQKLAKRNGIKNCTFIQKHSVEVSALPKADVLVSETLGNYALEENIIESIENAKRFLKSGAIIIPRKIRQYVCPVVSPRIGSEIDVWDAGFDIDFKEARELTLNNIYVKTLKKDDLLAEENSIKQFDDIDFLRKVQSVRKGDVSWMLGAPVSIFGFAVWWEAELVPGVTLSTSPLEKPTHWEQIYLPLLKPVACVPGDTLRLVITSDTRWKTKFNLTWEVSLIRGKKSVQEQVMDMKKGYIG